VPGNFQSLRASSGSGAAAEIPVASVHGSLWLMPPAEEWLAAGLLAAG
jgi:hypothetical protein